MHWCDMSPADGPDTPQCTDPTQHNCCAFVGSDPSTWRWCGQPAVAMGRKLILAGYYPSGEPNYFNPAFYYCEEHKHLTEEMNDGGEEAHQEGS